MSLASQDLDKNIPNLGDMSTTTTSMTRVLEQIWVKEMIKYLIKPRNLTLLESKEKIYL